MKIKTSRALILFALFLVFTQNSYSVTQKKVLIMDFKNISGNANYNYLEPSITEAVLNTLKKNFVFTAFPEKDWKLLAKNNFFFEDSFHTVTIGMQLGLLGKQDVVIGGGFEIRGNKIITKVHILGIAEKKIIKSFDITGYADNRIWDSVQAIADTIADVAKDVLPNDKEWSSISVAGRNQVTITADLSPLAFPSPRSTPLPSNQAFSVGPNDFPLMFRFSAEYMRLGILLDNLSVWGNFSFGMGKQAFEAENHDPTLSTIAGDITTFHPTIGLGYRVLTLGSFYLMPRIGAGFIISTITLDYTTLTNTPSAATGNTDMGVSKTTLTGFSTNFDIVIGYQLFQFLTLEFKPQYQHLFFNGYNNGNMFLSLNIGLKF